MKQIVGGTLNLSPDDAGLHTNFVATCVQKPYVIGSSIICSMFPTGADECLVASRYAVILDRRLGTSLSCIENTIYKAAMS